jgi:hypothetical protein
VAVNVSMGSGRALGRLDKWIDIQTDGKPAQVKVPANMRVFAGFDMEPYQFHFDGEVGGAAVTEAVEIKWVERTPPPKEFSFTVEGVMASGREGERPNAHFASQVEDLPKGKRVRLTLKPTHPEGRLMATLRARLNGKPFEIPVSGEMFRAIKVTPTYFNFNRVEVQKAATLRQEERLAAIDAQAFQVIEARAQFDRTAVPGLQLEVTPEESDGGKKHLLRAQLVVPAKAPAKGSFSGKVFLTTDHPEKPEIVLGFFGFFP